MMTYTRARQLDTGRIKAQNEWLAIVSFLGECTDIRKSVCVSCFGAKLYDKDHQEYQINGRRMSLQDATDIVEKIRKINAGS